MSHTFAWGKTELTLKEFVSQYRNRLPLLVRVSQGLCGRDDSTFSFATNEEFYITNINVQRRIVARDTNGRNLSIPSDYPIKFHELQHGKTTANPPAYLRDLVGSGFKLGIRIIPENISNLQFSIGADETKRTEITEMQVVDMYDDCYLVGNAIISGKIQHIPVYIPLFLSIKFHIAKGLKHGSKENFHKLIGTYHNKINIDSNKTLPGNPEIMLYTELAANTADTEYTYLEPRSIIACSQAIVRRTRSTTKPKTDPPKVPEKPAKCSIRDHKPPPVLPRVTEGQPVQGQHIVQKHDRETVKEPKCKSFTTGSPPGMPITSGQIHDVKLKHITRSWSTCDKTSYQNWPQEQTFDTQSQRLSLQTSRRVSIFDKGVYEEIPIDRMEPTWPTKSHNVKNVDEAVKAGADTKKLDRNDATQLQKQEEKEATTEGSGYVKIGDVPKNFKNITMKGVGDCLKLLHLDKYVEKFEENMIDGNLLLSLTDSVLQEDLGMSRLDIAKMHKFVHEGWRPK